MQTWIIADTHFCHQALTRLCGRPEDFDTRIDKAVRRMVRKDDILLHLGDVLLGGKGDAWVHENYITPWPGRKILVRGNHDKKSLHWYMNHGWTYACDGLVMDAFGKKILLTHRPAALGDCEINIHGHYHNSSLRRGDKDGVERDINHVLIALEYTNYEPILLGRVVIEGAPTGSVMNTEGVSL